MFTIRIRPRAFLAAMTAALGATLVMGAGSSPSDFGMDASLRLPPSMRDGASATSLKLPSVSLAAAPLQGGHGAEDAPAIPTVRLASAAAGPWVPNLRATRTVPAGTDVPASAPLANQAPPATERSNTPEAAPAEQEQAQPTAVALITLSSDPVQTPAVTSPVNSFRLPTTASPS